MAQVEGSDKAVSVLATYGQELTEREKASERGNTDGYRLYSVF